MKGKTMAKTASKKKTTRRNRKTAPPKTERARANWGANENPRRCRKCKSTQSMIKTVRRLMHPARTLRYRVCLDCGQSYSTLEIEENTTT